MNVSVYRLRIFLALWLPCILAKAQVITAIPANPSADDSVTVVFDASKGNRALSGHAGPVYAHTGVITGTPEEPSGWRYVQGDWGRDDRRMQMEPIGGDRYRIRFHIRSFYGIPQDEPFLQLAFVFRNQNGSVVAKDEGEKDLYYPALEKLEHGPLEKADGRDGQGFGKLRSVEKRPDGSLLLRGERQALLLRNCFDRALSFTYFPAGQVSEPVSEAVVYAAPGRRLKPVSAAKGGLIRWTDSWSIRIHPDPLRIEVLSGGVPVYAEELGAFADASDPRIGAVSGLRLRLQPGERLYGTGSRALPMDRRGRRLYAYNTASYGYTWGEEDLNISIPLVISSAGYGLFIDSYRRGYFDLGHTQPGILEAGMKDTLLAWYVMPGTMQEVVQTYTQLTGRQPLPPAWAMGYIQSRYGYQSQAETEDIVRRTIAAGFPLDAVLLDLYWFGGKGRMGDLAWEPRNWPDPEGMMRTLRDLGVRTIPITETYFVQGTRFFDSLASQGRFATDSKGSPYIIKDFWAGPAGLLDVFQPEAAEWYWPQYRRLVEQGAAGFWCDSGEPENHPLGMMHSRGRTEEIHNLYALYWAKFMYEQFTAEYPTQPFFNLMRSGFAGMQRYATFPWSGDVSRSWEALRAQPPIMLGAGICGIPFMHSDLGGFTGGPKDEELYTRWIQFGAFTPIMRVHGDASGILPEPIFFSAETQQRVKAAIGLRYRLLPYLWSLVHAHQETGAPLARPLAFHFPEDSIAARLDDEYLWGPSMLVAPVFERGAASRRVYLPAGDWYDFHTDSLCAGGRWHEVALTQDQIPVFVKAGSWIPMAPAMQHTGEYQPDEVTWHHYAAASGTTQHSLNISPIVRPFRWQLGATGGSSWTLSIASLDGSSGTVDIAVHGLPASAQQVLLGSLDKRAAGAATLLSSSRPSPGTLSVRVGVSPAQAPWLLIVR
ncbi:MAG: glycoside hydrolase family 31 protein [Bacteroidia bacterium]|nr:glycoside hydrolase family 31 protein [Bacteroidia bacterium]